MEAQGQRGGGGEVHFECPKEGGSMVQEPTDVGMVPVGDAHDFRDQ